MQSKSKTTGFVVMANSRRAWKLHLLELALVLGRGMGKAQWSGGVMKRWICGQTGSKNILIRLD
jgi:hypothetical protein